MVKPDLKDQQDRRVQEVCQVYQVYLVKRAILDFQDLMVLKVNKVLLGRKVSKEILV